MNRIVREKYPVADLPEDLREGLAADASVRVTIDLVASPPEEVLTLEELFAMRRPTGRSTEDIVAEIRQLRDEWDD